MKQFWGFTVALLLAGVCSVAAQDLIILRNGDAIEAKVMEVSPAEIRYRRFDHLDGPTIVIPTASVLSIIYENGSMERFEEPAPQAGSPAAYAINPDKFIFGISFNPAGFIPNVGGGASVTLDFSKGRFNALVDIRSGFGMEISPNFYHIFGIGVSFNYFHPSRIGGFYVGGIIELTCAGSYYTNQWGRFLRGEFYVGLALNIGYKFVTPFGMYFRTGANLGYTFGMNQPILRPEITVGWTRR